MEFAALDFETTGLRARSDAIVSFAVVPVRGGRAALGEGRAYREVSPGASLTGASIVIHGLRPKDLEDAPAIETTLQDLAGALERRFILAWAAEVEAAFLARAFGGRAARWRRRIVDVLPLAKMVDRLDGRVAQPGDYNLTNAAARFGIPVERPHHALDDALTTAEIFLALMPRLASRGISTPGRLLRVGRPPVGTARARRP